MRCWLLSLILLLGGITMSAQSAGNLKTQIDNLSEAYGLHFVYDSNLILGVKANDIIISGKNVRKDLSSVFGKTGIDWELRKNYVVLSKGKTPVRKMVSHPLELDAGEIQLDTIVAASITGKIDRNHNYTQTGLTRIDGAALNRGFAVLSSPDVLKTLQSLTGVSSGTEMLSSLYVHGGDGTDNLFLLDGVPLYQICHLGGIFSAFNTDAIESLDFYKSGFPARFGGRTSSVVDIYTKDGDFRKFGGSWSLGLLEGRFNIGGPIFKDKTSFNVALRRSWADLLMYPACWIINSRNKDLGTSRTFGYSFTDLNAIVAHRFSESSMLRAGIYVGNDQFRMRQKEEDTFNDKLLGYSNETVNANLSWGNVLTSISWMKSFNPSIDLRLIGYWSGSRTGILYDNLFDEDYVVVENGDKTQWSHSQLLQTRGKMDDTGLTADFNWRPKDNHHIRFGGGYIFHYYHPNHTYREKEISDGKLQYDMNQPDSVQVFGHDVSLYFEDEIRLATWLRANLGLRNTLYLADGRFWNSLEPRAAIKAQCGPKVNVKFSYSEMSQFSHKLASTYLDLPTDCWMPSNDRVAPMRSRQVAGGIYFTPATHFHLNLEGWWKTMDNLIEYSGKSSLFPSIVNWEDDFKLGKGRSYGLELDFGYETSKLSANVFYTLSWNERYFEDIWPEWYRDRNDNRHKLTLMTNWRPSWKWEFYAAWNYHTGSRFTVATQYLQGAYDSEETGIGRDWVTGETYTIYRFYPQWIYEAPNNVKMPDYHRLDIGMNIHKKTRKGHEAVWNISIYNVYCHMNPLYAIVVRDGFKDWDPQYTPEDIRFKGQSFGVIPIVPTFSYTCKF